MRVREREKENCVARHHIRKFTLTRTQSVPVDVVFAKDLSRIAISDFRFFAGVSEVVHSRFSAFVLD